MTRRNVLTLPSWVWRVSIGAAVFGIHSQDKIPDTTKLIGKRLASSISSYAAIHSEESDYCDSEPNAINTVPHENDHDGIRSETKDGSFGDQLILVWEIMTRNGDIL